MVAFVNRARMTTATTGTGTVTLAVAVSGFQTFAAAGITDGQSVRYVIEDAENWEIGTGTYTASNTSLSRSPEESSNAGSAINLSGAATVFVTVAATDVLNKSGDSMSGDLTLNGTGALKVPAGTTAQQPGTPANGMIRYNTEDAQFEGYADGAWGAIGGGGGDTQTATTTSTVQTAIASYAAATSLGLSITVIATDTVATERMITKLLVTHDNTTAVATQYGEVNTATQLATFDVDISGGNVRLLATAASANSTNFTAVATVLA